MYMYLCELPHLEHPQGHLGRGDNQQHQLSPLMMPNAMAFCMSTIDKQIINLIHDQIS